MRRGLGCNSSFRNLVPPVWTYEGSGFPRGFLEKPDNSAQKCMRDEFFTLLLCPPTDSSETHSLSRDVACDQATSCVSLRSCGFLPLLPGYVFISPHHPPPSLCTIKWVLWALSQALFSRKLRLRQRHREDIEKRRKLAQFGFRNLTLNHRHTLQFKFFCYSFTAKKYISTLKY